MSKTEKEVRHEKESFTEEFKAEAIKQVTEGGHKVVDVAQRLGISDKSL